jgi:chromosome segregation ATPase
MSRLRSVCWIVAASLVTFLAVRTPAAGQAAGGADTLSALLLEVHDLRVAMEQMASAGPRVQLAMGRLQLQEQRVNTMVRRADQLHQSVVSQAKELSETQDKITRSQRALESNALPPEERRAVEAGLEVTKVERTRAAQELQRLQAEETDAASQVANEQARWVEINQRLEELERALIRK